MVVNFILTAVLFIYLFERCKIVSIDKKSILERSPHTAGEYNVCSQSKFSPFLRGETGLMNLYGNLCCATRIYGSWSIFYRKENKLFICEV